MKKLKPKSSKRQSLARRRFIDLCKAKREKYKGPWKRPDRRRAAYKEMKKRWKILREYHHLQESGLSKGAALEQLSRTSGYGASTIRGWQNLYNKGGKHDFWTLDKIIFYYSK